MVDKITRTIGKGLLALVLTIPSCSSFGAEERKNPDVFPYFPGMVDDKDRKHGLDIKIEPGFIVSGAVQKNEEKLRSYSTPKKRNYTLREKRLVEVHWKYISRVKSEIEEEIYRRDGERAVVDPIGFDWNNEQILKYWSNPRKYSYNMSNAQREFSLENRGR